MPYSQPWLLLEEARRILASSGDRVRALQLGHEAIRLFDAEGVLSATSTRNAILRTGNQDLVSALAQAASGISWTGLCDIWHDDALSNAFRADGLSFLEAMISHGAPAHVVIAPLLQRFAKSPTPEILGWLVTRSPSPNDAVHLLFRVIPDCSKELAPHVAEHCKDIIATHPEAVVERALYLGDLMIPKTAAACVLAGLPAAHVRTLLVRMDVTPEIRRILSLGASAHAQIKARRLEPDIVDLLARSQGSPVLVDRHAV